MTIGSADASGLDVAAVRSAFLWHLRDRHPNERELAGRLLDRLPPERWALEWHLPWWLGTALGLDDPTRAAAVLGNVTGLAFVRLQDDLVDGELAAEDEAPARKLGPVLFGAALEPYRTWFEPGSPFWDHVEGTMATWRAASGGRDLAARGAPLRICAYGLCLRAGRPAAYPRLERCLDHAVAGLVRYDHVADWRADLEAGRWNAFVAAISPGPQVPADRQRHRRTVLAAMLSTDVVVAQFGAIRDDLLAAARLAEAPPDHEAGIAVPELAAHLRGLATDMEAEGVAFGAHYTGIGARAAELLVHGVADDR